MASGGGADFLLATLAVLVLFLAVAVVAAAAAGAGPFAGPARGGGAPPPYSGSCLGPDSDAEGSDAEGSDSDAEGPDSDAEGSDCSDAEGPDAGPGSDCSSVSVGAPGPGAREALLDPCADSEADSDADSEADSDAGPLGRPRGLVSESDRFGAPAPAAEGRTRRLEVRLPPVAWRPPAGAAEFHGPDGPGVTPGFAPHPALPDHDEPE